MAAQTIRTTVALPADLLRAADQAVQNGRARSRNELIARALRHELAAQQRAAIDAAFAGMADDAEAHDEALGIVEEFSRSDWEALQLGEDER